MRWDACNNRLLCMRSDELKLKERGNGKGRYDEIKWSKREPDQTGRNKK